MNCSAAAIYYEHISHEIYISGKDAHYPKIIHRKRLDHDIY